MVRITIPSTRSQPKTILDVIFGKSDDTKSPDFQHAQQALIMKVTEQFEGNVQRAFIAAINKITSKEQLEELAKAIDDGSPDEIMAASGVDEYGTALGHLNDAILDAFTAGGVTMADAISSGQADAGPLNIGVVFDRINPASVDAAKTLTASLQSSLKQEAYDAVQKIIAQQVGSGANPMSVATQIKQVIGLNAQQAQALQNYRNALQSGQLGAAKSGYSITQTDQNYIDAAMKGTKPLPQEKIDQLVENYRKRLLSMRAKTIARTESMSAVSSGADQAWQQTVAASGLPSQNFRRFWISTNDGRTRPDHVAIPKMNADGVGMTEPFKYPGGTIMRPHDPNAPAKEVCNCVLPGTRVYADGILATSRRPFKGNVVTIHTASGRNVTVTVNHPILTRHGWIRAKDIKRGHQVINDGTDDRPAKRAHNDHIPSRIEDVESALQSIGTVRVGKVTTGVDFHGDATDAEVRIVSHDRNLMENLHSALTQPSGKHDFIWRDYVADALASKGLPVPETFAFLASSDARMSSVDLPCARLLRHLAPLGAFGFGLATQSDVSGTQGKSDGRPTDPMLLRQLVDRNPAGVIADEVVNITVKPWNGHVYNLQTISGIYSANGIINHNCRCTQVIRYIPPTLVNPLPVFAGTSILP